MEAEAEVVGEEMGGYKAMGWRSLSIRKRSLVRCQVRLDPGLIH